MDVATLQHWCWLLVLQGMYGTRHLQVNPNLLVCLLCRGACCCMMLLAASLTGLLVWLWLLGPWLLALLCLGLWQQLLL